MNRKYKLRQQISGEIKNLGLFSPIRTNADFCTWLHIWGRRSQISSDLTSADVARMENPNRILHPHISQKHCICSQRRHKLSQHLDRCHRLSLGKRSVPFVTSQRDDFQKLCSYFIIFHLCRLLTTVSGSIRLQQKHRTTQNNTHRILDIVL